MDRNRLLHLLNTTYNPTTLSYLLLHTSIHTPSFPRPPLLSVPPFSVHPLLLYAKSVSSFGFVSPIGLDYIKTHLKEQSSAAQSGDTLSSAEEEDIFSTIKQTDQQDSKTKQLESYLASPTDTMDILKTFPSVCHLSLKLNTPLPASAACERLFSTAGMIFKPKRAELLSENLENLLLMKLNTMFC